MGRRGISTLLKALGIMGLRANLRGLALTDSDQVEITKLLAAIGRGDAASAEQLWKHVYDELHAMAQRQLANEPAGRTLQPTTLVHEVFFRLAPDGDTPFENRRHFFKSAAIAMRRIRTDDARRRNRLKRGGPGVALPLECEPPVFDQDHDEVLAVNEALAKLEGHDERKAAIVNLRYFAGLTVDETASVLGVSPRTVDSEWRFVKAWLHRELGHDFE